MTAPTPVLIIADYYAVARSYARDHDLGRENIGWRYVYSERQVRGMRPGRYVALSSDLPQDPLARDTRLYLSEYLRATGWTHGLPGEEG